MLASVPNLPQQWVIDIYYENMSRALMFQLETVVARAQSPFQDILIADLKGFGRALFLDGVAQSSQVDEAIYHEALVLPGLLTCSKPRRAFIAGGGEGAVLRELLRHPGIESITMVDIDAVMTDLAKEHLGAWHQGSFDDPRVRLLNEDARAYLQNTSDAFDFIVIDLADPAPDSPAAFLYTQEFYALVKSRLSPGGVMAVQAEAIDITDHETFVSVYKTVGQIFPCAFPYATHIPFFGSAWGFVLAGGPELKDRLKPANLRRRLKEINARGLEFYDLESHAGMFSIPKYLRSAIADPGCGKILKDEDVNLT